MDASEFSHFRKRLNKTQQELAQLMGTSIKAIHSYEQGWRSIPPHIERQLLLLAIMAGAEPDAAIPCWVVRDCPQDRRDHCPAWEFQAGDLCWFVNGTVCEGVPRKNWNEKMKICRSCIVMTSRLQQTKNSVRGGIASSLR